MYVVPTGLVPVGKDLTLHHNRTPAGRGGDADGQVFGVLVAVVAHLVYFVGVDHYRVAGTQPGGTATGSRKSRKRALTTVTG